MPKFLIEREIPGAGNLSGEELQAIAQKSCGALQTMGPQIQWVKSYVTGDKIYCVYNSIQVSVYLGKTYALLLMGWGRLF